MRIYLACTCAALCVNSALFAAGDVRFEDVKIELPEPSVDDLFGASVAIDGQILAVGAPRFDTNNVRDCGSVFLFRRGVDKPLTNFIANDRSVSARFGQSLAAFDGLAAIGAPGAIANGPESGAVYVYDIAFPGFVGKITPDDGRADQRFGQAVSISGTAIVVGVPLDDERGANAGAAYVFDRDTLLQIAKLSDPEGEPGERFGAAVAVEDELIAIGASEATRTTSGQGVVYLYDAVSGDLVREMTASDAVPFDRFGSAVSIDQGLVLVGAPTANAPFSDSGAAYLLDTSTGEELTRFTPSDAGIGDNFGASVTLVGGRAYIGSPNNADAGATYVFDAATGEQLAKLTASDGLPRYRMGTSVAVADDIVIAGSPGILNQLPDIPGFVYLFDLEGADCVVDWDDNGIVNPADVGAFLSDYFADLNNGTLDADFDGNGVVNPLDAGAFLSEYFQANGPCE